MNELLFLESYDKKNNQLYRAVEEVAIKLNLGVNRIEQIYLDRPVIATIWEKIKSSDIIIADLTKATSNLVYEIGLAHGLGKPVVIISKRNSHIISDLYSQRIVYYEDVTSRHDEYNEFLFKLTEIISGLRGPERFSLSEFIGPKGVEDFNYEVGINNDNFEIQSELRRILGYTGFQKANRFEDLVFRLLSDIREWNVIKSDFKYSNSNFDFVIWNSLDIPDLVPLGNPIPIEAKAVKRMYNSTLKKCYEMMEKQGLKSLVLMTLASSTKNQQQLIKDLYLDHGKIIVVLDYYDLLSIENPKDLLSRIIEKTMQLVYGAHGDIR